MDTDTIFNSFQLVIGCGQCGEMFSCSFEDQMGYYSIALNFNRDTDRVGEHTLIIEKGGTGRKKEIGKQWFREHDSQIYDFINKHIATKEKETKLTVRDILIVNGESGGAGSAISEELRKWFFDQKEYNIFQMSILPAQDEGVYFREESLRGLKQIRTELIEGKLKGVFLVGNEYVAKDAGLKLPPNKMFNESILENFFNIVYPINNNKLDFSDSHKYPDFGDYHTVLHLPKEIFKGDVNGGFLDVLRGDFSNGRINLKSAYFDSIDPSSAKAYFGVLELPEDKRGDKDFINNVFKKIDVLTKQAVPFKITYYNKELENPKLTVLVSGCNVSKKLIKEIESVTKSKEKFQTKVVATKSVEDDVFGKI
jgi:hypothetical protein